MSDTVEVPLEWFVLAVAATEQLGCPYCGSKRPFFHEKSDEMFTPRIGCLDCNRWFNKPKVRK